MEDETKTDAQRIMAEHSAIRESLDEPPGISILMAWVLGLACVLGGYILGNLLPLQVHP